MGVRVEGAAGGPLVLVGTEPDAGAWGRSEAGIGGAPERWRKVLVAERQRYGKVSATDYA